MSDSFTQYFERSFKQNWGSRFLYNYSTQVSYSYGDVAKEIAKMHLLFERLGVTREDKIAVVGPNSMEWAVSFLSVITYGAVAVPIQEDFHPDVIEEILNHSESKILFISDANWERLRSENIQRIDTVFSFSELKDMRQLRGERGEEALREIDRMFEQRYPNGFQAQDICFPGKGDDEMLVLIYTSGTTGFTKGVMLSGGNFRCVVDFLRHSIAAGPGDKVISFLPLAHGMALMNDLFLPVVLGSYIVYLYKVPSLNVLIKAMQEVKPEWTSMVPMFFEAIYKKHALPSLKKKHIQILYRLPLLSRIVCSKLKKRVMEAYGGHIKLMFVGGAGLNHEVEDFYHKIGFPYAVGYGMTECSPLVSLVYKHPKPHAVGKAIDQVTVKINSSDPYTEAGEILVKGPNVMKGYYKNEEATRSVFTEDGWLKTGDVGILDADDFLYIKGRTKNMILMSTGQNIYPEEIEDRLNHQPIVAESLVVLRGKNRLVALVYPNYPNIGEDVDPQRVAEMMEDMRLKVNRNLASYEYLSAIEVQAEPFEKTAKKSIKRFRYQ